MILRAISGSLRPIVTNARLMSSQTENLVLACNVYISEGRDVNTISLLENVANSTPNVALANLFIDQPYNRSNFTLVSRSSQNLSQASVKLAQKALEMIDFSTHVASHPRLGTVDHISCHPLSLGDTAEESRHMHYAIETALKIAEELGNGPFAVPTYLYGHAHPQKNELADIRRKLGYFSTNNKDQMLWGDPGSEPSPRITLKDELKPSFGPLEVSSQRGVCCIGAVPWIINFNILLDTNDLKLARHVAKAVSQHHGGLKSVQAMALKHDDGIEVACNLLAPKVVGTEVVEQVVREKAGEVGVSVLRAYRIGKSVHDTIQFASI